MTTRDPDRRSRPDDPPADASDPDAAAGVLDEEVTAAGLSWLLGAMALVVLDVRVERFDVLSDVAGFALALLGVVRVGSGTRRTGWTAPLVGTAVLAIAGSVVAEAGAVLHGTASGIGATAGVDATAPAWVRQVPAATTVVSLLGVLALARHMRSVLTGIAADRWRQVTIAWSLFVVTGVAALATGAIELIVLAAAAGLTAGLLLVLSLLATRRLLEEDWPPRSPGLP